VQRTPSDASALGVQEQHMEEASERAGVSKNGYPVRR
jgi:hypothetical protein